MFEPKAGINTEWLSQESNEVLIMQSYIPGIRIQPENWTVSMNECRLSSPSMPELQWLR